MKTGIKHLIECHCVLPQFMGKAKTIYHKFIVFSVIDESDTVVASYEQCNNCGTIHKVYDLCRSEIIAGKDQSSNVEKINDVKISLPKSLVELFESYKLDLPDYQYARFILENEAWESTIVLDSETDNGTKNGKIVRFISSERFRVEPFLSQEFI